MSDRLLLYNKNTEQYVIFAKDFGSGYSLGNVNELKKFLDKSSSFEEIIVGDLDILPKDAININTDNHWEYYPKEKNDEYLNEIAKINQRIKDSDVK